MGELSSTLEHDECLVIVGATELFPEECTEEEPVESFRFGTTDRTDAIVDAFCGCLAVADVVGAKAGQSKSFAPLVETFTKVLEALSLSWLLRSSKSAKRSKRPMNEPVSTREI